MASDTPACAEPLTMRQRIKSHRRMRAGDLVPHELNFRLHPHDQKEALAALYREVGFARSLLGYELPDGRIKLIDGHLRRAMHPDLEVEVEIVDLSEDEARLLMLSLDPLAALAETNASIHERLRSIVVSDEAALQALWRSVAEAGIAAAEQLHENPEPAVREQVLILIECTDEAQQAQLLERFQREGLVCRALLS